LIGASQGGIILGRQDLINAVRKNQFARILRVGKLTLAALEATLKLFLDPESAKQSVPTIEMITRRPEDLKIAADFMASQLKDLQDQAKIDVQQGFSQTGSGSLPTQNLQTSLLTIQPKTMSAQALGDRLRSHQPPIITRIQNEQLLIDPRTLCKGEDAVILRALHKIIQR
jgi:L-seryl-tRNA(Ser) seleniumtransferase